MNSGLSEVDVVAFVPIVNPDQAKKFYGDTLGLRLVSEEASFALVFDANGIMLRLAIGKERPSNLGTVLGWRVPDIYAAARGLQEKGVGFEHYDFFEQDEQGIWTTPTGAKVAWFKDPDGNVLSISEHPEWKPNSSSGT